MYWVFAYQKLSSAIVIVDSVSFVSRNYNDCRFKSKISKLPEKIGIKRCFELVLTNTHVNLVIIKGFFNPYSFRRLP